MFTKNYINFTRDVFLGKDTSSVEVISPSGLTQFLSVNTYSQIGHLMRRALCRKYPTETNLCGVYFGSGSTPATVNDITLEAPIVSGLSITNADKTLLLYDGNGVGTASASYTVKNTTEEEINIREIGCFATGVGQGTTGAVMTLFERTVLDNPITIQPGVTKLITYKLTFNHR